MIRYPIFTRKLWLQTRNITQKSRLSTTLHKYREIGSPNVEYKEGDVIHGFVVDRIRPVEEMYLTAVRLTHIKSGAQYLHLNRDDNNNVFSVGFRTTPTNSTGVPHILEHLALCGSEKYPCRDPFFKMLRRSLATFMNAMTAPDYTFYPFSTQNLQDYKNLTSVYLDSVFKPTLRKLDFQQEGWRLEHSEVKNKNSPIVFKGVVFNEMKGVFSNNQNIFARRLLNSVLPSHTYGVESGGDPLVIPTLEYNDLLKFHATHYHPSNARFYSYGNFPLTDHLNFINREYLSNYDKIDISSTKVPSEPRWSAPKRKHISCKSDPLSADVNRQNSIAVANLWNDINDLQQGFDNYVLAQLLLDGPNSVFYKPLISSQLSAGFGPMTGYESQCKDTIFIISLQGVKQDDFDSIEKKYNETILKAVETGFTQQHVDTILHGIELQIKHQTSNFGLNLLYNLLPIWNHDGDVIQSMKINDAMNVFKTRLLENPKYLQNVMEDNLLKNGHKLILTMSPDASYEENYIAAENKLLKEKLKDLSAAELEDIYQNGLILQKEQEKIEDVGILPTLKIKDLKHDVDRYKFDDMKINEVHVQITKQPTNGVCYYRSILGTKDLTEDLKMLLPLFNEVVVKMGTENYNYEEWDRLIHSKTGGLSFSNHVAENLNNSYEYEEGIIAFSYCLNKNSQDMWRLWDELYNKVRMTDLKRFETLVKILAADVANSISDKGHMYAMSAAASLISPVVKYKEQLSGLSFVNRMKQLAQLDEFSPLLDNIKNIAQLVLSKAHMRSALNISNDNMDNILKGMEHFHNSLKGSSASDDVVFTTGDNVFEKHNSVQHVFPFDVNYVSKAIMTKPYNHVDHAPLQLLAQLLSSHYLHPQIREQGGAYGGGAKLSPDGILMFYSYRDPHSIRTLDTFDGAYDFLSKYSYPDNEIIEAKLSLFQKIDMPIAPGDRGLARFTHHLSADDIQKFRQNLKAVTKEQLSDVAERYLNPNFSTKSGRALVGPKNVEINSRKSEKWHIVDQETQSQAQAVNL